MAHANQNSIYRVGDRVRIHESYGYPANVAVAVLTEEAYYAKISRNGWYMSWDYGRPTKQWESSGGWIGENMIVAQEAK